MDIKTPLRTMIKVSDTHGWAAGKVGLYLGYNAQYDTVKVGFVNETGEYTGEFTRVPRSAASVVEAKPARKPAKTPWTSIARILKDMGLKQGPMGDFVVTGHKKNGERVGTYVVLTTRKANDLVDENADEIERLSDESGWVFHVSTRYNHETGHACPDICNFGERVRRERPGAEKPAPPVSDALTINTERANADLANVVFEGDPVPDVYVAAGSALADTMQRLRSEDVPSSRAVVRDVLHVARQAGFVMGFPYHGSSGTAQFGHRNGNVLMITFENGVFTGATGYGWGKAPWAVHGWDTNDFHEFTVRVAD